MTDQEQWKPVPIPEYADLYLVSSHGRVKRSKPTRHTRWTERCIQHLDADGYPKVLLYIGPKGRPFRIQRLVALAFIGPPPAGKNLVCHRDGIRTNNRADNLFWGSPADNSADMIRKGRSAKGARHPRPRARITEDVVRNLRSRYAAGGVLQRDLAREIGYTIQGVNDIIRRKTWAHVE